MIAAWDAEARRLEAKSRWAWVRLYAEEEIRAFWPAYRLAGAVAENQKACGRDNRADRYFATERYLRRALRDSFNRRRKARRRAGRRATGGDG